MLTLSLLTIQQLGLLAILGGMVVARLCVR